MELIENYIYSIHLLNSMGIVIIDEAKALTQEEWDALDDYATSLEDKNAKK